MDMKKLALAIVVAVVILIGTDYLVHGMWLSPTYEQLQKTENSFRDFVQMEEKMWLMWVGRLIFSVLFVWVYTKGMENKPWFGQAFRYAVVIWLFFCVPGVLDQYVLYRVPYRLAFLWMAVGAVQLGLISLTTAAICKKS